VATALARPFRPGRLANDPGVVAPHGATCGPGCAHRDLDLPQSATAVAAAPDWQFDRAAAVRITIWIPAVRIAPVAGTVGIAHIGITRTVGHRVGRRSTDGIRYRIACPAQSRLEALAS
jgi:hypothetical protein